MKREEQKRRQKVGDEVSICSLDSRQKTSASTGYVLSCQRERSEKLIGFLALGRSFSGWMDGGGNEMVVQVPGQQAILTMDEFSLMYSSFYRNPQPCGGLVRPKREPHVFSERFLAKADGFSDPHTLAPREQTSVLNHLTWPFQLLGDKIVITNLATGPFSTNASKTDLGTHSHYKRQWILT